MRRTIFAFAVLSACGTARTPRWPAPSPVTTDGGESLAPRARYAIEAASDDLVDQAAAADEEAEHREGPVGPTGFSRPPDSPSSPGGGGISDEPIQADELVIEIVE